MTIFNDYGQLNPNLVDEKEFCSNVQKIIDSVKKEGASIVELRAVESLLISCVQTLFAEDRLRTQSKMRKKGLAKYKCFYDCKRCNYTWEKIDLHTDNSDNCPECTYANFPFKAEDYKE